MTKNHEALFCKLTRDGKTLRNIERELRVAGCDTSRYTETRLLKNMIAAIRKQPLNWE